LGGGWAAGCRRRTVQHTTPQQQRRPGAGCARIASGCGAGSPRSRSGRRILEAGAATLTGATSATGSSRRHQHKAPAGQPPHPHPTPHPTPAHLEGEHAVVGVAGGGGQDRGADVEEARACEDVVELLLACGGVRVGVGGWVGCGFGDKGGRGLGQLRGLISRCAEGQPPPLPPKTSDAPALNPVPPGPAGRGTLRAGLPGARAGGATCSGSATCSRAGALTRQRGVCRV
jgi:hypothetical protein